MTGLRLNLDSFLKSFKNFFGTELMDFISAFSKRTRVLIPNFKNPFRLRSRTELITKVCEDKSVLDVGCTGMGGRLHKNISKVSTELVGIDIDSERVSEMKKKGFEVYNKDAESFTLDRKFNVIVAGEIIEHLNNPSKFLDKAKNHLKSGGKLILTTPNIQSAHKIKKKISGGTSRKHHVLGFNKNLLKNLLERNGFEVIEMRNIDHDEPSVTLRGKLTNFLLPEMFRARIYTIAQYNPEKSPN